MRTIERLSVFSLLSVCLLFSGCGDSIRTGTVEGNVTLNGKTYADAAVIFLSLQSGAASNADIQADGNFKLPDPLPTGNYKVYLAPKSLPDDENGEPTAVSMDETVPEKYWNEAMTDISVDVQEGENKVTIELKK